MSNHPYGEFLAQVEKPARYAGGEVGAIRKDWATVEATVCLAFPEVYEIGMSHLGYKILYDILNKDPRTLAERCYAPWADMEAELRARSLPLVALESQRSLRDFDVVGFSLQFELSYTNVLLMLELGGIPLRSADRDDTCPLVLAGGPTATHPEPLAPFIDAFVIGDGEAKATEVALTWARLSKAGTPRRDRLVALARLGAVYVPSLYETRVEPISGLHVVAPPSDPSIPFPVTRSMVDLRDYPFPARGPIGGPEAIFDRLSVEIARGCTEGCRFCQAGMIYRPLRERDPAEIAETVVESLKHSGYDEVSLTALSTADVSCIGPLVTTLGRRLAKDRVSLGIASLRAYGLAPDLLDELKRVRATGLTFAPEAGTQRMRDVVNKNVTEAELLETADRVFSRGFGKMKLYFMIGLPTETDEDVVGIVETAARTLAVGRRAAKSKAIDVTVSVSTHVPKPHTPFQWAAMDSLREIERKQQILRNTGGRHRAIKLKTHASGGSVLEGVMARGDRRLADVIERAYTYGARFDSWDERLRLDAWNRAFEECGVDQAMFLGTLPVGPALPWSHIDVGLEDGFLAREYRKALKNHLSPPCGKYRLTASSTSTMAPVGEGGKLVCYDCGIACDLSQIEQERATFALRLPKPGPELPVEVAAPELAPAEPAANAVRPAEPRVRYRFRYEKTGAMALLGHLDVIKELGRVFRRVGLNVAYTGGFHPKPDMTFGPALSLGVLSLDEYVDVSVHGELAPSDLEGLVERMTSASPNGFAFRAAARLDHGDPSISKVIRGARYLIALEGLSPVRGTNGGSAAEAGPLAGDERATLAERIAWVMGQPSLPWERVGRGEAKTIEVRGYLRRMDVAGAEARTLLAAQGVEAPLVIDVDCEISMQGGVKASEVAAVVAGTTELPPFRALRAALFGSDGAGNFSPLDVKRARSAGTSQLAARQPIATSEAVVPQATAT